MPVGTVNVLHTQIGFGFIQPDDGSKDVFVHITAVEAAGMRTLKRRSEDQLRDRHRARQAGGRQSAAGVRQAVQNDFDDKAGGKRAFRLRAATSGAKLIECRQNKLGRELTMDIIACGSRPSRIDGARASTATVWQDPSSRRPIPPASVRLGAVRAGARTAWHTHPSRADAGHRLRHRAGADLGRAGTRGARRRHRLDFRG